MRRMNYRKLLGRYTWVRMIFGILLALREQYGFKPEGRQGLRDVVRFILDYRQYQSMARNPHFQSDPHFWQLQLRDRTLYTSIEPVYFFQDTWAASKIFALTPRIHYDIGSHIKTIGILSQFVPIVMIDIRPPDILLNNLHFCRGSILELPFAENSIESLSSLCVIEHIGLGRYGDPLNPWGSEQAIAELQRVVRPSGHILFSVPVDATNRVYFNAHRAFTREYVLAQFNSCELIEEQYQYGQRLYPSYLPQEGFGTGLFMFQKC